MLRLRLLVLFGLCLAASGLAAVRMLYAIIVNPARAWVIAIAHDQLANAAANGDPDETISSRADRAREKRKRWGCVLCRFLDWLVDNHCTDSRGV